MGVDGHFRGIRQFKKENVKNTITLSKDSVDYKLILLPATLAPTNANEPVPQKNARISL